MAPGDGYLRDAQPALDPDKQNLRVEAPALNPLQSKYQVRRLATEGLEATLRIRKRQPHDGARQSIETSPEDTSVQGLFVHDAPAQQPARPYRHIRTLGDRCKQPLGCLD